jgi:indolepyruvate ferredoxin oxidoreductase beta subunit
MNRFSIYLGGVGGQANGLLSEVLLRAADHAGLAVKAVDTHGLAQRGGIVVSQIRIGDTVHSPLICEQQADLVVSLERHEALRAVTRYVRDGGTLIYYNTVWQPLGVRLGEHAEVSSDVIEAHCSHRGIRLVTVFEPPIQEARMQNMVLLARISCENLVPGISAAHYLLAMEDLMAGAMLEINKRLFESLCPADGKAG